MPKGHDSTTQREEGFLEALAAHKGIEIVSSNQYLGADVEGAVKRGEAILSNYRNPDGSLGIDAIFCVNESTTFALMRVLQDHGWAGKVKLRRLRRVRQPDQGAGRRSHRCADHPGPGQDGLSRRQDAGVAHQGRAGRKADRHRRHIATKENMNEPAMKELLKPDLSKWLK